MLLRIDIGNIFVGRAAGEESNLAVVAAIAVAFSRTHAVIGIRKVLVGDCQLEAQSGQPCGIFRYLGIQHDLKLTAGAEVIGCPVLQERTAADAGQDTVNSDDAATDLNIVDIVEGIVQIFTLPDGEIIPQRI